MDWRLISISFQVAVTPNSLTGVAKWITVPWLLVMGSLTEPPPMLADMSAGTWIKKAGLERLGCYADLYTVSRCHTRGESEE